jgi:hypothetical protein
MNRRHPILFAAGFVLAMAAGWSALPGLFFKTAQQPLQFNHKIHMGKGGMTCDGCHSIRPDGTFTGVPGTATCAGCHATPLGTTAAEKTLAEVYIKAGREIEWGVYARQPMNVRFSHALHAQAKLKCEDCHGAHGTTTALQPYRENRLTGYSRTMPMMTCERCHDKRGVQAGCLGCHR